MNQTQSIRALSVGLIKPRVAQTSADHRIGLKKLPQKAARREGSIGSRTAKSNPTRLEIAAWLIKARINAVLLNAFNCARSALAIAGSAIAASRLTGYHMLP